MKASAYEQEVALTNGVVIREWLQPKALVGIDGHVSAIELERTTTDSAGRLSGTRECVTIDADQVFKAIGQTFVADALGGAEVLTLEAGRIAVDADRHTSLAGVWAGGDCVTGGEDLTVAAVEDGKIAAAAIHAALST